MRIALTADPEIPVPPSHYGGIERIVDLLARNLVQRGHEVTLFANPDSTCPVRKVAWTGRSSGAKLDVIRNSATLAGHILRDRFDIVHSFSRLAYLLLFLPLRVPKLMSYQREISPRTTRLAQRISRDSLQFSAVSRKMMENVEHIGRWHLVPNGVSLDSYTFRSRVDPDAPLVFLGRLEEIKGPHLAIEAALSTGLKLILAGNVPDTHRAWFDARVAPHIDGDQISYVGPVDDQQKNNLLGGARALLMPILWEEPFGIVMAEAMACGTPVIGLSRGAVPEVVEHGVTGFVADDLEGMIAAVGKLDAIQRSACRTRVEKYFSDRAVTEAYISTDQKMLSESAAVTNQT